MTAIYLCDVTGAGTRTDPYRFPAVFADDQSGQWEQLMVDTVRTKDGQIKNAAQKKGLAVHRSNTISGIGGRVFKTAANGTALVAALKATAPANPDRNFLNAFTDANGYARLSTTSWWVVLVGLIDNVAAVSNPVQTALRLEQTILAVG